MSSTTLFWLCFTLSWFLNTAQLRAEKIPFLAVEPGVEVSAIDWSATLPQLNSLVHHHFDSGRIHSVKPVTFAVAVRESRVVETMSCVLKWTTLPTATTPGKEVAGIGFFYRFPYEFNGEWVVSSQPKVERNPEVGAGWIPLENLRSGKQRLPEVLREYFPVPFWPRGSSSGETEDTWVLCCLFTAGLAEATGNSLATADSLDMTK